MDEKLKRKLRNQEYRAEFAEALLDDSIAFQIRTLRDLRRLSQAKLGELTGMKQGVISRIERSDYGRWRVSTLKRIARALDLPLFVRFESWGKLLEAATHFTRADLSVPTFEEDPVFTAAEQTVTKLSISTDLTRLGYAKAVDATAPRRGPKRETGAPLSARYTLLETGNTAVAGLPS